MDEEDSKTAFSQITDYDKFVSKQCPHSNRTHAVVVVPPKTPNTQEKWVAVSPVGGVINTSIQQPNPERKVICGHNECCLCYWLLMSSPSVLYSRLFLQLFSPSLQLPSSSSASCQ